MTDGSAFYAARGLFGWQLPPIPALEALPHPQAVIDFDTAHAAIRTSRCQWVLCDVFDTLVERSIAPAGLIAEKAASFVHWRLLDLSIALSAAALLGARRQAIETLAGNSHRRGEDGEFHLQEAWESALATLLPTLESKTLATLTNEAVAYEVAQEFRHCRAVPHAAEFLASLLADGCQITAVSDTYLDSTTVSALLGQAGLTNYLHRVYASCDHGANKRSGRLFDIVLEREAITASEAIHVGDNPVSDFLSPRSRGISAVLLQNRQVTIARNDIEQRIRYARMMGCPDYLPLATQPTPGQTAGFMLGFQHFGLAFALFSLHVLELDRQHNFDRIYFVSRDGHLPYQAFREFAKRIDVFDGRRSLAKSQYVHLSRMSTLCPQTDREIDEALFYSLLVSKHQGALALFSTLGLDEAKYASLLIDAGFPAEGLHSSDLAVLAQLRRLVVSSGSLRGELANDIAEKRSILKDYLKSIGFFSASKVLLVDIGWRYRISHNIAEAFSDDPDYPEVHAALWGYTAEFAAGQNQIHPGFFFDARRQDPLEKVLFMHRDIVEAIASEAGGTCLGYSRVSPDTITPILSEEAKAESLRTAIQEGVVARTANFADQFNDFHIGHEFHLSTVIDFLRPLIEQDHPLHSVVLELGFPSRVQATSSAMSGSSIATHTGTHGIRTFINQVASRIDLNLGAGSGVQIPQLMESLLAMIQNVLNRDRDVILWGFGLMGSILYPHLCNRISKIIDVSPNMQGKAIGNHLIIAPEQLADSYLTTRTIVFTPLNRALPDRLAGLTDNLFCLAHWLHV